jgi:REP element-mobilizing transposase RayT
MVSIRNTNIKMIFCSHDGSNGHFGFITIIKSITAREIIRLHPEVKRQLWGSEFWTEGYFTNTVGRHGNEQTISLYVKNQGIEKEYKLLHKSVQLTLF